MSETELTKHLEDIKTTFEETSKAFQADLAALVSDTVEDWKATFNN